MVSYIVAPVSSVELAQEQISMTCSSFLINKSRLNEEAVDIVYAAEIVANNSVILVLLDKQPKATNNPQPITEMSGNRK